MGARAPRRTLGAPDLFERSVRREGRGGGSGSAVRGEEGNRRQLGTKSSPRPTTATPTAVHPPRRRGRADGHLPPPRGSATGRQPRPERLTDHGDVVSLVDGWFVDQMLTPSFPRANAQYGYLGWTHPGAEPALKKGKGKGNNGEGSKPSRIRGRIVHLWIL